MSLFATASNAATTVHIPAPVLPTTAIDEAAIIAQSKALSGPVIDLPGLARPMHTWQDAALAYCFDSFERWGCALLGDDMGLGKTAVALALISLNRWAGQGPAVVVTPPANLGGYQREIRDAFPGLKMFIAKGRTPRPVPVDTDIVWMSDDALTMRAWLASGEMMVNGHKVLVPSNLITNACMYVRDEIHRDKGQNAKPTLRARLSLLAGNAMREAGRYVVGMTGTLTQNRPVEGFLPLQIIGGDALVKAMVPGASTMGSYLVRYCKGDTTSYGTTWNGADHTAELHNRLRATVYVRREKKDIDPEALPHFGWQVLPFALGGDVLSKYIRAEKHLLELILEEKGPEAAFRASRAETIVRMQRLWMESGIAKAKMAAEYVANLIDESGDDHDQVIVWYQHTHVFDTLLAEFTKAGLSVGWINGQTHDRRKTEDDFQDGKTQVMLAQLQAAGQAVTLTAARHSVWVQTPWSAGMLAQQRDRNRRCDNVSRERAARGETVQYHVLQAAKDDGADTFDMAMWNVVERKAKVCDAVNAGQDVTLPDEAVMYEVLQEWYAGQA